MRHRAQLQDDGQLVTLSLVAVVAVASLAAIEGELAVAEDMHGVIKVGRAALAGVTVLSSWAFIQVMFTLRYAHDYCVAACHGRKAGMQFADDENPDYGDFFCFASVIGTSCRTADVSFRFTVKRATGWHSRPSCCHTLSAP